MISFLASTFFSFILLDEYQKMEPDMKGDVLDIEVGYIVLLKGI